VDTLQDRNVSSASAAAYLQLEGVSKRFGEFLAVNNVSLVVERGEIFCLLGASGSGKTTLLRLLAGFEIPSAGRLLLDGQDLAGVPPYRRPLNMMFQSYALFPHLTVERNVAFGLEQERLPKREIAQRVGEILDVVKMSPYRGRRPDQLSGGQRQRVALARSLVKRPKLLLLDEPLGALDRKLREHTQFELLSIQQQLGVTFIVVTHDQEEAMTLASRIGIMDHGEIVQIGTPRQIYEFPATRFVADFIGSVNLFDARVAAASSPSSGTTLHCSELSMPLQVDASLNAGADAAIWVALRPEKIALSRAAPVQSCNWAHGTVREIAYLGDLSVFLVRLDSGREVRVTLTNSSRESVEQFTRDSAVYLSWDSASPIIGTR
jgi:putrescine transport system ATP-binding protein